MKTGIFLEYLGEVSGDLIPQNLANANELKLSIEDFRDAFPHGFTVSIQIEQRIYETPEEKKTLNEFISGRLRRASGFEVPGRKLIGFVLTPRDPSLG